jgi:hypothetical protein
VNASWDICRNAVAVVLDFDGVDELKVMPPERAYGGGLYFSRVRRETWKKLNAFMEKPGAMSHGP